MQTTLDRRKIAVFGLIGAIGCLVGWGAGEAFLAATESSVEQAPSLVSLVVAAPIEADRAALAPPPLPDAQTKNVAASVPAPPAMAEIRGGADVPEGIFALRTMANREEFVADLGGSQESETAVQDGLAWLARHQADGGQWSDERKCEDRACTQLCYNGGLPGRGEGPRSTAETGLAILAFQAGGHYYFNERKYSANVRRGLDWLVENQGEEGRFFGRCADNDHHSWYQHGIATFALAEACAVARADDKSPDPRYRSAAERAIRFMASHQYRRGGWQYSLNSNAIGDTSVTGWQMLALKSAIEADIEVTPATKERLKAFFDEVSDPRTGMTGYQYRGGGTQLTTAVGLIYQKFFSKAADAELTRNAADHLKPQATELGRNGDFYTLYNANLAMFLAGGDAWKNWNEEVRDAIIKRQVTKGCERGSWLSSARYSRTLDTAWAVLALEVYYRYAKEQPVSKPALYLAVSPTATLHPGSTMPVVVRVGRDRVAGVVRLECKGDLTGLKVAGVDIAEAQFGADKTKPGFNQALATVDIAVDSSAALGRRELRFVVRSQDGTVEAEAKCDAAIAVKPPMLLAAVSPEVVLLPGTSNIARIRIVGENLTGPIKLRCEPRRANHDLAGVTFAGAEVAPGATVAELKIDADSAAAGGNRELKIVAESTGVTAEAEFVVRVDPVPPTLRISTPPEVAIKPKAATAIPFRIARERFTGPVTLRLVSDQPGIAADAVELDAARDAGEFLSQAAEKLESGKHACRVEASSGPYRAVTDVAIMVASPPPFSWWNLLRIGAWTGLLAAGLASALAAGQSWYLSKRLPRWTTAATLSCGGLLAGLVAGGIGQGLFSIFERAGIFPLLGFLLGWCLLGLLLGRGIGLFIPNLHGGKAALAGAIGGLLGAAAFVGVSAVGDTAGRFVGAALLGFCIGLVVAIVEAAFRDAWLEISYGREMRTVNLGTNAITIGAGPSCTVWTRTDYPVALKFWLRDGQIMRQEVPVDKTNVVGAGHREKVGTIEVSVRTGKSTSTSSGAPAPSRPPPPPPPVPPPAAKPSSKRMASPQQTIATPAQPAVAAPTPAQQKPSSGKAPLPPPPPKRPPPPPPRRS